MINSDQIIQLWQIGKCQFETICNVLPKEEADLLFKLKLVNWNLDKQREENIDFILDYLKCNKDKYFIRSFTSNMEFNDCFLYECILDIVLLEGVTTPLSFSPNSVSINLNFHKQSILLKIYKLVKQYHEI